MKETCVPLSDQWPVIAFENIFGVETVETVNRAILISNDAMIHVRITYPIRSNGLCYITLYRRNLRGSILIKLPVFPAYCKRVYHRLAHQIITYV